MEMEIEDNKKQTGEELTDEPATVRLNRETILAKRFCEKEMKRNEGSEISAQRYSSSSSTVHHGSASEIIDTSKKTRALSFVPIYRFCHAALLLGTAQSVDQ
ncbi:hypothetical protein H6P81_000983 [Aristolochia fimbriata]|uniref:Uncharacterized protein n=1 Tax=Aristolochia fimbriata TaxID=158543 RepID=A0AAV7F896_ARIFI|nr:hypothetical protein H6P81_000983 [Aristolochia fimbriata]